MLAIEAELLGTVATAYGLGAAGAALLQARQIRRRGSSGDVSARFFATYAGGRAVWLLYGISIESMRSFLSTAWSYRLIWAGTRFERAAPSTSVAASSAATRSVLSTMS